MALNYYTSIDLNQNQLIQPRIENLASDPAGVEGQLYYNTGTDKLRVFAGGAWVNIDTDTDTGITGVTLATGTSSGAPLTESITGRELTLTSMAYAGGSNIGYVPAGGTATKVLLGNGTWADYETGDVEGIDAGLGIVVNDPTTSTPEVAVDYAGANNVIASAADGTSVTLVDSDDFLFLDPPYYLGEDSKMFKGMYPNCNFAIHHNNFDHELMRDLLKKHKGGFFITNNCPPGHKN